MKDRCHRLGGAALVTLAVLAATGPGAAGLALAQTPSETDEPAPSETDEPAPSAGDEARMEEARALFLSGREAASEGRWTEAVERFSRSYELSGEAPALFNLAVALRALGRHREARDALRRLLTDHSDLEQDRRAAVERLLAEQSLRLATLTVFGLEREARYELKLDGDERPDDGERPLRFELDPGSHRLVVRHAGAEPFTWQGELEAGEVRRVEADLGLAEEQAANDSSLWSSPVLWGVVGAAVLAGAAVTLGVTLSGDAALQPSPDADSVVEL